MNEKLKTLPGYQVNEYLLVINLPEDLTTKILNVKEQYAEKFKASENVWGKPQLALASFAQYAMMEERILSRLRMIAMAQYPFKVELKNFGSFPSHTVYINCTSKLPIQNLVKSVRTDAQRIMKLNDEHKPHFMMEPHINIASKLKPWQYEKSWLEYSTKNFTGRFIADHMMLLKRPMDTKRYQLALNFDFQNLPVNTKQGELFG